MLKEQEKFILPDLDKKNELGLEVNWNGNSEKLVKVTLGGQQCTVRVIDLYKFIFVVCDTEQQSELLPIRKTEVRKYVKQHRIRAKKDIKVGDELVVNCEIDVPLTVVDGLTGSFSKRKSTFAL